jgi:hypothetical protein
MLLAVLAFTKGLLGLGNVHLHSSTTAKTNSKDQHSKSWRKYNLNKTQHEQLLLETTTDTKKKKYCKKRKLNPNPPWASSFFLVETT